LGENKLGEAGIGALFSSADKILRLGLDRESWRHLTPDLSRSFKQLQMVSFEHCA